MSSFESEVLNGEAAALYQFSGIVAVPRVNVVGAAAALLAYGAPALGRSA